MVVCLECLLGRFWLLLSGEGFRGCKPSPSPDGGFGQSYEAVGRVALHSSGLLDGRRDILGCFVCLGSNDVCTTGTSGRDFGNGASKSSKYP